MKITKQLLRSQVGCRLVDAVYIDLSDRQLVSLENLSVCPKLQTILASQNDIDAILTTIIRCRELWKIDLSCNRIRCLEGFGCFYSLGTINLANNNISWTDLQHLRNVHILDLCLYGNKELEKDPNYRAQVIDGLPYMWMLDGKFVTSYERKRVENFFKTANSKRPMKVSVSIKRHLRKVIAATISDFGSGDRYITHKSTRRFAQTYYFVPSYLKDMANSSIYGAKAMHMMKYMPVYATPTQEIDEKRLIYLAYNFEQEVKLASEANKGEKKFRNYRYELLGVEELLVYRSQYRKLIHRLLFLLIAKQLFDLPSKIITETLKATKLLEIGSIEVIKFFHLSSDLINQLISVIFGAVQIDLESNEDNHLNQHLFICLYNLIGEIYKKSTMSKESYKYRIRKLRQTHTSFQPHYRLMAQKIILMIYPSAEILCSYLSEPGVEAMISAATGNYNIPKLMFNAIANTDGYQAGVKVACRVLAETLLANISSRSEVQSDVNTISWFDNFRRSRDVMEKETKTLPRPHSSPALNPKFINRAKLLRSKSAKGQKSNVKHVQKEATVGDPIIVDKQYIARIISLPSDNLALIAINASRKPNSLASTSPINKYSYITLSSIRWNPLGYWVHIRSDSVDFRSESEIESKHIPTEDNETNAVSISTGMRMVINMPTVYDRLHNLEEGKLMDQEEENFYESIEKQHKGSLKFIDIPREEKEENKNDTDTEKQQLFTKIKNDHGSQPREDKNEGQDQFHKEAKIISAGIIDECIASAIHDTLLTRDSEEIGQLSDSKKIKSDSVVISSENASWSKDLSSDSRGNGIGSILNVYNRPRPKTAIKKSRDERNKNIDENITPGQNAVVTSYIHEREQRIQSAPAHSSTVVAPFTSNTSCQQRPNSPALPSMEINLHRPIENHNTIKDPRSHRRAQSSPIYTSNRLEKKSPSRLSNRSSRSPSPRAELSISVTKIAFLDTRNNASIQSDTQGYIFQGLKKAKNSTAAKKYFKNAQVAANKNR
ncbi:hypothetical protein TrispH2_001394 [Trichoplax sp. H2]|nr:hypothetical protein TrispH2_001394 [Trichoplax sp. H2]|eukprot:RDD46259.1 hypothetical protein TrispH2_001394 [Trichoplax sp. H2]